MLVSIISNLQQIAPPKHGTQTSTLLEDEGGKSHRKDLMQELKEIEEKRLIQDDEEIVLIIADWLIRQNNN